MNANDFVTWQVKRASPTSDPLRFWDALWSLFSNNGDFYRLIKRTMRPLVAGGMPANEAMSTALQAIFVEVLPLRDVLLLGCIRQLRRLGLHESQLTPDLVGQDWGQSQLTPAGVLTLRVEMWTRRRAALRVEAEGQARVTFPRLDDPRPAIRARERKASTC